MTFHFVNVLEKEEKNEFVKLQMGKTLGKNTNTKMHLILMRNCMTGGRAEDLTTE